MLLQSRGLFKTLGGKQGAETLLHLLGVKAGRHKGEVNLTLSFP